MEKLVYILCIYWLSAQIAIGDTPDRCLEPYEQGNCTSHVHKWYFNRNESSCFTFIYGGCFGNENRFDSEVECLIACKKEGDYTLPPYMRSTIKPNENNGQAVTTAMPASATHSSVPFAERNKELTFNETGHQKVFMFAKSNTFIQLDGNQIQPFQLRLCREISFQFRTKLPHGLLVYHSIKDRPSDLEPYALYIIVEKGQLKVVHVFGKHSTSLTVGKGLNKDEWHNVTVRIDVHGTRLIAEVNKKQKETLIKGLDLSNNYGIFTDLPSVVLIGGLSPEEKLHGVKYIIESFVGCIRNFVLSSGKAASDLLPINPLIATKHENVVEGCIDKCKTRENLCFVGSTCINHYHSLTCDCFGRNYEGEQCDIYSATILTLRGSSYVSYRVYDWKDRVHSDSNRISLQFKTRFDDSALFYASGEPDLHYIAVSLKNQSVYVEANFGNGMNSITIGEDLASNYWNNLTISHYKTTIKVYLNNEVKEMKFSDDSIYLYIDPEIYFGGGSELHKKKGLISFNNFVGSMKYAYFNDISVFYDLKNGNPKVHYIGVLPPEYYQVDVEVIPITFAYPSAHFWWLNNYTNNFSLKLDFKTNRSIAVLAGAELKVSSGQSFWELKRINDDIRFEITTYGNVTLIITTKYEPNRGWHTVELTYHGGELSLRVDFRHMQKQIVGELEFGGVITIGGRGKSNLGLIGCLRDISINGEKIEPRYVVRANHTVGEVSLDNCQLVNPCMRPNACEHGGKCSVKDDHVECDCSGTGYIGKNCHFSKHRKTCEELALLGYTKPDVYWIDIDGNGRFPPAHVKCEFQSAEDSTKTIVEHNLPSQIDVRSAVDKDFSFSINYREFTPEMLQELISHSLHCSQHIKYDCYKAPLDLHSATWFESSGSDERDIIDFIGEVKHGACPCEENRTCINPKLSCNCDAGEAKWHVDEGYYSKAESLGITKMVFLQQKAMESDAQGRITLGPLECIETNTQRYVVTFTSSQSYIEIPGWRKGDISFSFRTTGERAILLYQPPIRPHYPSFMVALTSDFTLTFNFTLNTGESRELEIKSGRKLNGGEWQKIWIDYNEHHVRFMINTEYQMVDLLPTEEFGPFEGSMYIGGATEELLGTSSVQQGLIGCFRGLVVNGEILNIYSYLSVHLSEIIKDCKPSCDPNPCENGAKCKELWRTSQCVCENKWAHTGQYCEKNINLNALTFVTEESHIKSYYVNSSSEERLMFKHLLDENILINLRTYDQNALILYANDHMNNFIQLHIILGKYVVFMFNSGNEILNITVEHPEINSGKSIQVAVIRTNEDVTLHVNDYSNSVAVNFTQLQDYSNKPWINPEKEVMAPQRPPARPTEYFQVHFGGYDSSYLSLLPGKDDLKGFVGCIRGLKIGEQVVNFSELTSLQSGDLQGIKKDCKMMCDEAPCKNKGICVENFAKGESTCDCQLTSYYGESCDEEKAADFQGDSAIQRKFSAEATDKVKVHLAFSSIDDRKTSSVLLLIKAEGNQLSYYLLVALTMNGHLFFEEMHQNIAERATIDDRYFLNGARHSVYYKRINNTSELWIDRELVPLSSLSSLSVGDIEQDKETYEIHVGGLNTTEPAFAPYKSFKGCLSNVIVEVNSEVMKPLDEYMHYTKPGEEQVNVVNAGGVRISQCAVFDVSHKPRTGLSLNNSQELDDVPWNEEPPQKVEYKSFYSDPYADEDGSSTIIFLVLFCLFLLIVIGALCEVYRSHRKYVKRMEEEAEAAAMWPKVQVKYSDTNLGSPIKLNEYKGAPLNDSKSTKFLNGSETKVPFRHDYKAVPDTIPENEPPNNVDKRRSSLMDKELEWDPLPDNSELLLDKSIEDLSESIQNNIDPQNDKVQDDLSSKPEEKQNPPVNIISNIMFPSILEDDQYSNDIVETRANRFPPRPRSMVVGTNLSPIFLNEERRSFGNPISYLGGPRLPTPNRASKESVLSLD